MDFDIPEEEVVYIIGNNATRNKTPEQKSQDKELTAEDTDLSVMQATA